MEMNNSWSKYLFALFVLFIIFTDEMFYSFVSITKIPLESGLKGRMVLLEAIIAYLMLLVDVCNNRMTHKNRVQFVALIIIMGLYILTSQIYIPSKNLYWSAFLVYGALCIPSAFVGMRLARNNYEKEIYNLLPFFVLFISLIVVYSVMTSAMLGVVLKSSEDEVFNYQSASYFLAFCYTYCFFYVFYNKKSINTFWRKVVYAVMLALLFVCAVGCLMGGGRGAFIYIVLITAYLFFRVLKRKKKNNTWYVFLLIVGTVLMVYLSQRLNIFESAGFIRMQERITDDENRTGLWELALNAFKESPLIGNGIGSIWWTVGFYSHNFLLDLLAETGIIGTSVILYVLYICAKSLIKWSRFSSFDMFMLIIFLGALVHDTFSGYWISSFKLFLIFGYVYAKIRKIGSKIANIISK